MTATIPLTEEALAVRLRALEDERGILRTLHRYSHCMDYGLTKEWSECFAPDGVFDVKDLSGKRFHRENNRKELAAYLASKKVPPERYDKHIVAAPLIEVKGNTATATSYFVAIGAGAKALEIHVYGRYEDTMVKTGGEWLIKERIATVEGRMIH
ncbi:MAG: nuclear transport factor 2 family protein [Dehalococcoidia bacterium]|nr:nuclear transport factor 2 family protein [Dehalococcoidia bacterium]